MRFDCIRYRKATTKPQSLKGAFIRMNYNKKMNVFNYYWYIYIHLFKEGSSDLIAHSLAAWHPLRRRDYGFTDINPSTYGLSCITTAKACLTNLLATATTATLPGLPLDRRRSKHALHSVLHLSDENAATYN